MKAASRHRPCGSGDGHRFFDRREEQRRILFQADVLKGNLALGVEERDDIGVRELPARIFCVVHAEESGALPHVVSCCGFNRTFVP
jgi:hypothetical protein